MRLGSKAQGQARADDAVCDLLGWGSSEIAYKGKFRIYPKVDSSTATDSCHSSIADLFGSQTHTEGISHSIHT